MTEIKRVLSILKEEIPESIREYREELGRYESQQEEVSDE